MTEFHGVRFCVPSVGWLPLAILVMMVGLTEAATTTTRNLCGAKSAVQGQSEAEVTVGLIQTLGWSDVTVICRNCTDDMALSDLFIHMFNQYLAVRFWENSTMMTKGDNCGLKNSKGFLVLGTTDFMNVVFSTLSECWKESDNERFLFNTEWLVIPVVNGPHVDVMGDLSIQEFQNVVVLTHSETGSDPSLWTLVHEQNNSHLSLVTSLPHPHLTRDRLLPNTLYGLGGRTLRVVVKTSTFFVFTVTKNGKQVYKGIAMELLDELASRLNFTYTLTEAADDSFGQELANGQWDGPIGMLTRKEADLAVSVFAITEGRSSVADATTPFLYSEAVIMFRPPNNTTAGGFTFFLQPFHTQVYALIAGSFLGMLILLLVLENYSCDLNNQQRISSRPRKIFLQRTMDSAEISFVGLLSRPTSKHTSSRGGRTLVMTWFLFGVILSSMYSSQLTSMLTVQLHTLPFNSLSELLSQDVYTWGVAGGTNTESMLKNSTNKDFRRYYEGARRTAGTDPSVLSPDFKVQLDKVIKGNYAFFSSNSLRLEVLAAQYLDVDIAVLPETFMTTTSGFYLQKGSPYTRLVSEQISLLMENGMIDHWRQKWSPQRRTHNKEDKSQSRRVIGLWDTQAAFYLTALGLATAALVCIAECLFHSSFNNKMVTAC